MKKQNKPSEILKAIVNLLEHMSTEDIIALWNTYCDVEHHHHDDVIYENDEYTLNELFPTAWSFAATNSDYNIDDNYIAFDDYGYLNSFCDAEDINSPFDFNELSSWLLDNIQYIQDKLASEIDDEQKSRNKKEINPSCLRYGGSCLTDDDKPTKEGRNQNEKIRN